MKIAVLNYSGNVGKTTIARDLLHYNLQDYDLVTIESINSDGKEHMIIRGDDRDKIYTEILVNDDLILDIGSSNLESYLKSSEKEEDFIDAIDMFVIPVTPQKKQQADTIKTVRDVYSLGASNIHVIFNQVAEDSEVSVIFSDLISALNKLEIKVNEDNFIFQHNLYSRGHQLSELIDNEDYLSLMKEAKSIGENQLSREYAQKFIHQKKVNSLHDAYRKIFNRIMEKS